MELQCADLIDAEWAGSRGVFGIGQLTVQQMAMSAFPQSGRSDHRKSGEKRVRFRPQAAIELNQVATSQAGIQDLYDYMVLAYSTYR